MASIMNTSQGRQGFLAYFVWISLGSGIKVMPCHHFLFSQTFTLHFVLINYAVKKKLQCRERREGENEEFSFLLIEYS